MSKTTNTNIGEHILPVIKRDASFIPDRGEGCRLYDAEGRECLDFSSSIAVTSLGHCHPEVNKALINQANKLWIVSNRSYTEPLLKFSKLICDLTFADYFFGTNSGTESIDLAIKTARRVFYKQGLHEKNEIISFNNSFHGRTLVSAAACNYPGIKEFGSNITGFKYATFNDIESVKALINKNTAAILMEPVQGESGVNPATPEFIKEVAILCKQHNALLILDEIQTGFGRCGELFAYKHYGVQPDILAFAKCVANGFPMGGCLFTKQAASGLDVGFHGSTFANSALATAIANTAVGIISDEKFMQNIKDLSASMFKACHKLQEDFPNAIHSVRGLGLMIGIQLKEGYSNADIFEKLTKAGLMTTIARNNVVRLLPPFIITQKDIDECFSIISRVLKSEQ